MFGETAVRGHVWSRAGTDGAAGPGSEHASRPEQIVGVDAATLRYICRCVRGDTSLQGTQVLYVLFAELVVVQALGQDNGDQAGHEGRVFSGPDLKKNVSEGCQLGATGVDDDQLHAVLLGASHHRERVRALQAANRPVARHHWVVPDRHEHICVGEVVEARFPDADAGGSGTLGRLVDCDRGVERRRLETLVPGSGDGHGDGVLVAAGSRVAGYGAGTVRVDDVTQFCCDLVESLVATNGFEVPVGAASKRRSKATGGVHLFRELAALDARVALK